MLKFLEKKLQVRVCPFTKENVFYEIQYRMSNLSRWKSIYSFDGFLYSHGYFKPDEVQKYTSFNGACETVRECFNTIEKIKAFELTELEKYESKNLKHLKQIADRNITEQII